MSESRQDKAPVPRQFLEDLGFDIPEEAFSFYVEDSKIVFNVQNVEEVGCSFMVQEVQEESRRLPDSLSAFRRNSPFVRMIDSPGKRFLTGPHIRYLR